MRTVGVRELKNRLSHYLRLVREGERVLVSDRGEVVAEVRRSNPASAGEAGIDELVRRGLARAGGPNEPGLYPPMPPALPTGDAQRLLDLERGER